MAAGVRDPLREVVLPLLSGIKSSGGSYTAKCPSHEDGNPSLSVSVGKEHPVVLHCHAGCTQDAVLDALGLTWSDISNPDDDKRELEEWTPAGPASDVYDYRDENGELLFQVLRVPQPGGKKTFRQRVPDVTAKKGWRWSLGDVRRVPYRLPDLMAAVEAGHEVYIAEGEKDVHALLLAGVAATCNSGGAGKWTAAHSAYLAGAVVRIVADRDGPGQGHARQVARTLADVATSVTILEPAVGKDAHDHLAAGKTVDELVETWSSSAPAKVELSPDLHEFLAVADADVEWVIPGLLERGDRMIWTGFEGMGKSVAIRQIAIAAAAGIHPFNNDRFPPRRVLFIDCENSERQGRRHFRDLEAIARGKGRRVPDGGMFLIHRPAGIDLSRLDDAAWLLERVTAHQPDLIVCGPFYRLHMAAAEEEQSARRVVAALDAARVLHESALLVEHHAPHGDSKGNANRSVRPFGSSLLMRWPELGMGITPNDMNPAEGPYRHMTVARWRGDRGERDWPTRLMWSGGPPDWPWVVDVNAMMR